jgi:hypothetical protein
MAAAKREAPFNTTGRPGSSKVPGKTNYSIVFHKLARALPPQLMQDLGVVFLSIHTNTHGCTHDLGLIEPSLCCRFGSRCWHVCAPTARSRNLQADINKGWVNG